MKTTVFLSVLAALTMLVPTGAALALPDYNDCTTQPGLAQRVVCTANATIDAVRPVIEPAEKLVMYEVDWAKSVVLGVANDACEHTFGQPCTRLFEASNEFPIELLA